MCQSNHGTTFKPHLSIPYFWEYEHRAQIILCGQFLQFRQWHGLRKRVVTLVTRVENAKKGVKDQHTSLEVRESLIDSKNASQSVTGATAKPELEMEVN